MKTKHSTLRMQIKALSDDGTFEGLLSPYGNVDQGDDVVEAGAFTNFLKKFGNVVPMLWQHLQDCPIGSLTLSDQTDGLYCKGKLFLDTDANGNYLVPEAAKAYGLLKAGIIKGLSIGYETVKAQTIAGIRHLKELKLFEGSVVTFPMNTSAGVNSVKNKQTKGGFTDAMDANQLRASQSQMVQSITDALTALPWSGDSRDEILSAAQTSLDEFTEAYMAYLPVYLDYLSDQYGMDTKAWQAKHEVKEGRKISTDTHKSLTEVKEHCKSAFDALDCLLSDDDPEDDDTDDDATETKAHADILTSIRSLLN